MSYKAYVTKLKNVRKHPNADRMLLAECFDNTIIVGLDSKEDDLVVYFPVDGKLSVEYCEYNNLIIKKDENGNNVGGYLDAEKRNIRALKLRGEKSDGLAMPLSSLDKFTNITKLKIGDEIDILNGVEICCKYIPKTKNRVRQNNNNNGKRKNKDLTSKFIYFEEHKDTEQLDYNLNAFKEGDICYITNKMHGTSARTSVSIVENYKKGLFRKIFRLKPKVIRKWDSVSGSRRVVLTDFNGGFYGGNAFRKHWHDFFKEKLHKGEEIFYELTGWANNDTLIMPSCDNKKTKDKEFIKKYGETTVFDYGCQKGENKAYVYRMTKIDEDGNIVEYPFPLVKLRCEEMGVEHVLEYEKFIFTTEEDLKQRVNKYLDIVDPIGKTHVNEGIIVKIDNRKSFTAFKKKGWYFKILEGIIKEDAIEADIEESQELIENL